MLFYTTNKKETGCQEMEMNDKTILYPAYNMTQSVRKFLKSDQDKSNNENKIFSTFENY
jgi:hypothetical protein